MKRLTGVAAASGTAVAKAYVYRPDEYELPSGPPTDPDKARAELAIALDTVALDLEQAARDTSGDAAEILRAQAAMARDPALREAAGRAIVAGTNAARAILQAGKMFARELAGTDNEYLAARAPDVLHICDLAARALVGAPPRLPPRPVDACVLVADDLTPSDTTELDPALVLAIVTRSGSRTSHTSVIARGMGIPAVVAVRGLLDEVRHDEAIGVDGDSGTIYVEPGECVVYTLEMAREAARARRERIRVAAGGGPAETADGCRVEIAANIRSIEELRAALAEGAEAVGLLRTELLYIDRDRPPSEEEQRALLSEMHGLLGERRLVVRTFDIGADKQVPFLPVRPEHNPELGVRGIRLARAHPDLLDTQLRAIAASAHEGPTAVMAPMIATVEEAAWFVERALDAGVPHTVELGVMVEVPALLFNIAELPPEIDFCSIGTNDLTQYLHAADRRHAGLTELHDPFLPAVLHGIDMVCRGAGTRWVGVCGEAASDPAWAAIAVGLGVRELSMQAVAIPEVRAALRHVTLDRCRDAAACCLTTNDPDRARAIARKLIEEQT